MWTVEFWKEVAERSLKTAAQFVLGAWGIGDGLYNAFDMDWGLAGGAALGGAILSLLTSIVSAPFGNKESPSLVTGEPDIATALTPNGDG